MNKKMRSYSVEDLLVGQYYRSPNSHKEGEILSAEKTDKGWKNDGCENYLISYRYAGNVSPNYAIVEVRTEA